MSDKNEALSSDIKFQLVRKLERHKVIGLAGPALLPHEAKYMEFHRLSGVILFERNIESLAQVSDLVAEVTERLAAEGPPPLVMVDHEGDYVSELRRLIGVPPSVMAIAATGDVQLAHDVALETGKVMGKLGVNTVLAPVADCYLDPLSPVTGLRTFGSNPEKVAAFVDATIRGFREAGVLTCVKHFPGHGDSAGDSHATLPTIAKDLDALWETDIVPFERAVKAGVDMVMTAHVAYPLDDAAWDQTPASFDARLIRSLLRETIGFNGAVITDALEMEGARLHARSKYGGLAGGFERAILAGSDLLLYSSPIPEQLITEGDSEPMIAVEVMQTIIETLSRVVDRTRIDAKLEEAAREHEGVRNLLAILDASYERVAALRRRADEMREPPVPRQEGKVIHLDRFASVPPIYQMVAARSIVLVRDPESFLPIADDSEWTLLPIEYRHGEFLKRQDLGSFMEALYRRFRRWKAAGVVADFREDATGRLSPRFVAPDRKIILDAQRATGADLGQALPHGAAILPVFSARARPPEVFMEMLGRFIEQQQTPFVIVTGAPVYDWVPEEVGCLLTLGASPSTGSAAAAVLVGEARAAGKIDGLLPPKPI